MRSMTLAAALLATATLAACGDNNTADNTPTTPAPVTTPTPAPAPVTPAPVVNTPMAPVTPSVSSAALTLADIAGRWAPTVEACTTGAVTIATDVVTTADGPCAVTSATAVGSTVTIAATCAAPAPNTPATWTITATNDTRPAASINVAGTSTGTWVRCP